MTSWKQFCEAAPELARRVEESFGGEHHTMATIRAQGSPRISGTCVEIADEVRIGMMPGTRRADDIRRDPRIALHSKTLDPDPEHPETWAGEGKLSGRAVEVEENTFVIEVEEAVHTRVENGKLLIEHWHHERGLTRHERG